MILLVWQEDPLQPSVPLYTPQAPSAQPQPGQLGPPNPPIGLALVNIFNL